MTTGRPVVLAVEDLAVVVGGRCLLAPSSFALHEGERVLLAGPSGAGKSLFVDLLLGFAGPETPGLEVGGRIRLEGEDVLGLGARARRERLGAVFQVHAPGLFDDLTVRENLLFGSRDAEALRETASRFGLEPVRRKAIDCSGGERVRVVLARTLLKGAEALVYDEPTAGLDLGAIRAVVEAIQAAHRRLSLVVTHDYEAFAGFPDRVLFLDPGTRRIRPVTGGAGGLDDVRRALETAAPPPPDAPPQVASPWRRLGGAWGRLARRTAVVLADVAATLLAPWAWLRGAHPLDGPRVRRSLRRDLAPGVALFVAVSAFLVALTATYFLFEHLPERRHAEALFLDDLLSGLGLVQVRVAVPLLVSVLLAAKLGASTAAWLGHMSLTRQVDALELLGVPVRRHLLLPAAAAQLAASWIHTAVALGVAWLTTLVVFLWSHPGWSALYVEAAWSRQVGWGDLPWLAAKVGASALAVSAVAFRAGVARKRDPGEVVGGIHRTLLHGLLAVLAIHALFAFLEFG